jgi:hypothetical protein
MGDIRVFDLKNADFSQTLIEPTWILPNASECVTAGLDIHPSKPFLATTHGTRVFPIPLEDDTDDILLNQENEYLLLKRDLDNSLKLWKF